jgi:hypothetical protein
LSVLFFAAFRGRWWQGYAVELTAIGIARGSTLPASAVQCNALAHDLLSRAVVVVVARGGKFRA